MNQQLRISDAQLENLLRSRAAVPDPQLLADIVAMSEQLRQRRGLLGGLAPAQRSMLLLATVALLLAALAGAIMVGSGLVFPNRLDLGERDSLIISRDECGLVAVDPVSGETLGLWRPHDPCEPPRGPSPDGRGPAHITHLGLQAAGSRDGLLAYTVTSIDVRQESELIGLWTLDLGSGQVRHLGECEVRVCLFVDISADGERIVYSGWDGTADGAHGLAVTDAGGRLIWSQELGGAAHEPRFSPDGSRILFAGYEDGLLHVAGSDGSGIRRIIEQGNLFVRSGSWSPDGERVAFATVDRQTDEFGIWVADADGANARQLASLEGGQTERHGPVWSPDGEWIAYARRTDHPGRGMFEVRVTRSDGSEGRQVYEECCEMNTIGSVPAWSPDGELVAFAASRRDSRYTDGRIETPGLYVVRRDGSGLRRVADVSIYPFIWQRLP